jgi:hypothetical protein
MSNHLLYVHLTFGLAWFDLIRCASISLIYGCLVCVDRTVYSAFLRDVIDV